mmetsp:Transcript_29747/g.45772  ORF Transcript_29747/g.45772 Transcript_29747/m.45772 type:complete len:214 (-) Transcript_29747:279-920(-)
MHVATHGDVLSRWYLNVHDRLLLLQDLPHLVQDLPGVLDVEFLLALEVLNHVLHKLFGHLPLLQPRPLVCCLHLDAVRVDLRGWGVVHANGRLKLLFLDRLVAVVELRPSLLVRRLDLHSLPEVRLGLLQLVESQVCGSPSVVALDVGWIQRDGLRGIDDGAAIALELNMAEGTVGVKDVISAVVVYGLCVQLDRFVQMTLRELCIRLSLELL